MQNALLLCVRFRHAGEELVTQLDDPVRWIDGEYLPLQIFRIIGQMIGANGQLRGEVAQGFLCARQQAAFRALDVGLDEVDALQALLPDKLIKGDGAYYLIAAALLETTRIGRIALMMAAILSLLPLYFRYGPDSGCRCYPRKIAAYPRSYRRVPD